MSDEVEVLSVSQLTREIRALLEENIGSVWVEGEVSNLRRQASGHQYFTLKDEGAQLSCVLFRGNALRAITRLADGAAVRLFGDISVYEARGSYQMVVRQVQARGQGVLQARFEALKARLHAEGLFDAAHKQTVPRFPLVVALVTSPTGAAIRDMLNILARRAPWVRVLVCPVRVQGQGAEQEIADTLRGLNALTGDGIPRPDVIVAGRGGGSLEDLWNFNEEVVARAIFDSAIPVISAVGHEIDFTIADFVADLRAPTPSAAAELLAPDKEELSRHLAMLQKRLAAQVQAWFGQQQRHLDSAGKGALMYEPQRLLREAEQVADDMEWRLLESVKTRLRELGETVEAAGWRLQRLHPLSVLANMQHREALLTQRLSQSLRRHLERSEQTLEARARQIQALGPLAVLARGFSFTVSLSGRIVTSPDEVSVGESIQTHLAGGVLRSVVEEKRTH